MSHSTEEPAYERLVDLTYRTVTDEHRAETRASWNKWDVIVSLFVCTVALAAYLYL